MASFMSWSTLFCFSKPTVFPLEAVAAPLSSLDKGTGPLHTSRSSPTSLSGAGPTSSHTAHSLVEVNQAIK